MPQAIVIAGPQGCGKSRLAREMAAARGSFAEIGRDTFLSTFRFGNILSRHPATVIVEDAPARVILDPKTRALAESSHTEISRKGHEDQIVPTPTFIFCTSDPIPDDCGFRVIRMGAAK